jgi:hypothetical protein
MQPTSDLCRTQEARQRSIAASATLANVKTIANAAAAAWAKEAHQADLREGRKSLAAEARFTQAAAGGVHFDNLPSENPDRGFANA